jgi:hypothetical protein
MLRCSRFLPALLTAFTYALVAPVSILVRMHSAGWRWIWNDSAFGFFMVVVFPFAVAVFSCVVDMALLKEAVTHVSKLTIPVAIFLIMLAIMPRMVYLDLLDIHRSPQPYMYEDPNEMGKLNAFHEQAFKTSDLPHAATEYRTLSAAANKKFSPAMLVIFYFCNFINVGFGVAVFCYILLVSVAGKIGADVCNHLVFVLAALAVWFPSRAYADWFINLGNFSWISTYQAAAVIIILFVVGSIILALRMLEGSLYHRFVIPAGAISVIIGAIAALKPHWLTITALTLEGYDPIYRVGLALIIVALLYYISTTIHQKATP